MVDIRELSESLQSIIAENDAMKKEIELYKNQLLIILVNNGGRFKDLDYRDLNDVDWTDITLSIGNTTCSVFNKTTGKIIHNWAYVPEIGIDNGY